MRKQNIFFILITFMLLIVTSLSIFAASDESKTKANANITLSTIELDAETDFSCTTGTTNITFDKPGKQETIEVKTTNSTDSVLRVSYSFSVTTTETIDISNAVLVYLNDEYVDTLASLSISTSTERLQGSYVNANEGVTDKITLELHLGANESIFDDKTISLTISAYTENADYEENIYVSTDDELTKAVDDINNNNGLLADYPTIILLSDVSFNSDTITNSFNIDLNDHTLSGDVTLNGDSAYLWCSGKGTNSATVDLTSYNTTTVKSKLISAATEALAYGIDSESSCDLFGNNKFYLSDTTNISITSTDKNKNYSFETDANNTDTYGTIKANSVSRTQVESITVCGTTIEFKILDTVDTLSSDYLQNIPTTNYKQATSYDSNTIYYKDSNGTALDTQPTSDNDISSSTYYVAEYTNVTYDLFLPTSIPSEGAIIEWESSKPSIMDNTGKIVIGKAEKEEVTLYATIYVNGNKETKEFTFLVSTHTNEVNFYKMVAEMSPIVIYEIVGKDENDEITSESTGLYDLPRVDNKSTYDYRKDYTTPSSSSLWDTIDETVTTYYNHNAYQEIFLESITYDEIYESDGETLKYDFIDLTDDKYQVYLKNATLQGYAEITITGTFETGESYSSKVIIIISSGSDTTIFDQAFEAIDEDLQETNVLKNILETRVNSGIAKESGDFTLPSSINKNGITFTMKYEKVSGNGVVTDIDSTTDDNGNSVYEICLDLEQLSSVETTVPITVTATWGNISKTKTLYFTVPAALHTADFDNATIFNSVKAQVIQQLHKVETKNGTGFDSTYATNNTPDYILIRDIIGDSKYTSDYYTLSDDYLYEGAGTYEGCTELWFYTSSTTNTSYTDNLARDFVALINWATGDSKVAASNVVIANKTHLGNYTDTYADGKEYLTDDEVDVLKTYYMNATGKTEDDWDTIWNQVAERAAGYVMTNGSAVEKIAQSILTNSTSYNVTNQADLYFKYTGVMEWATNFKDNTYNVNTDSSGITWAKGVTSNPEQVNYNLVFSTDENAPTDSGSTITVTWAATSTSAISETSATYTYIFTDTTTNIKWYYNATKSNSAGYLRYNINSYSTDIYATDSSGNTITVETLYDKKIANYLDDDTSYITPGELEVIFSFILSQTYTTDYSDITDTTSSLKGFESYVSTFYKNAIIPTYFTDEGISLLISNFYTAAGISGENGFKVESVNTGAGSSNGGLTISNQNVSYAPTIVNLDNISSGLSYFTSLELLYIQGNSNLPAFLSEYGLNTALATAHKTSSNIEILVLEHVADNYVSFSLEDIKNFTSLTQIDVSDNEGITNVDYLVNYLSDNYTYIDISNVNVDEEYYQYVLNNTDSKTTVYYTADDNERTSNKSEDDATAISSLSELEDLIAENMYLATEVDNSTSVYWRIESGNKIVYVEESDDLIEVDSADKMQELISSYYYIAGSSVTYNNTTLIENSVYLVTYEGSDSNISASDTIRLLEDVYASEPEAKDAASKDLTSLTANTNKSNTSILETEYSAGDTSGSNPVTTYVDKNGITFNCYKLYYGKDGAFTQNNTYVLYCNNSGTLSLSTTLNDDYSNVDYSNVCFIGSTEFENFKSYIKNPSMYNTTTSFGHSETKVDSNIYDTCYLYFPATNYILNFDNTTGSQIEKLESKTTKVTTTTNIESSATCFYVGFAYDSGNDVNKCKIVWGYTTTSDSTSTTNYYTLYVGNSNDQNKLKIADITTKITSTNPTTNDIASKGQNSYNWKNDLASIKLTIKDASNNDVKPTQISNPYTGTAIGVDITKTETTTTVEPATTGKEDKVTKYYYDSDSGTICKVEYYYNIDGGSCTTTTYEYKFWYYNASNNKTTIDLSTLTDSSGSTITIGTGYSISITDSTNTITITITENDGFTVSVTGTVSATTYSQTDHETFQSGTTYYNYSGGTYTAADVTVGNTIDSTYYVATTTENVTTTATYQESTTYKDAHGNTLENETAYNTATAQVLKSSETSIVCTYVTKVESTIDLNTSINTKLSYEKIKYVGSSTDSAKYYTVTKSTDSDDNTTYTINGEDSTATYNNDYIYTLSVNSNDCLFWEYKNGDLSASLQMEEILKEANEHFADSHYGEYYGMYYAYNGPTTSKYTNGTIYRIMPNYSNSAFIFVTTYFESDSDEITFYCSSNFEYNDEKYESGNIYTITKDCSTNDTTASSSNIKDSISDINHNDTNYSSNSINDETEDAVTTAANKLTYNYFILKNGNSNLTYTYMFASAYNNGMRIISTSTANTYINADKTWKTMAACKMSILTDTEYKIVLGKASATTTTVGVANISDIICATLTIDNDGKASIDWGNNSATPYYLYFPSTNRFAGSCNTTATSVSASNTSGAAYYIAKYETTTTDSEGNTTTTYTYIFFSADQLENTTFSESTNVLSNTIDNMLLGVSSCVSSKAIYTNSTWILSNEETSTTQSGITIQLHGTFVKDTTNSRYASDLAYATVYYGENQSDSFTFSTISYVVSKTNRTINTKNEYVKIDNDTVYYVTYSYIKNTISIEISYTYIKTASAKESAENIVTTTLTYNDITKIEYTFGNTTTTIDFVTIASEKEYEDTITKTPITILSDSTQLSTNTSSFGLSYNTFYTTYASSDIMSNLAKNSWEFYKVATEYTEDTTYYADSNGTALETQPTADNFSSGTYYVAYTNSDMVGKIFRLIDPDKDLQADNYVKIGGFYTIYYDEDQGTYSLKTVANIDYSYDETYSVATLINMRMLTVLAAKYDWKNENTQKNAHTGTGGSYSVTITVMLHTDDDNDGKYTDTIRKYKIQVVG